MFVENVLMMLTNQETLDYGSNFSNVENIRKKEALTSIVSLISTHQPDISNFSKTGYDSIIFKENSTIQTEGYGLFSIQISYKVWKIMMHTDHFYQVTFYN